MNNEGIVCEAQPSCFLCGKAGQHVYHALRDQLYDVPGTWNLLQCSNCDVLWLDPCPLPDEVGKLYANYHTHGEEPHPTKRFGAAIVALKRAILARAFGYSFAVEWRWRVAAHLMSLVPMARDRVGCSVMWLHRSLRDRLIDVGCGNGAFLARMRSLGWSVQGVEPDHEAVLSARNNLDLDVVCGTLEAARFPDRAFDVVTLNHVIEHLPDPVATLRECHRVLQDGGRVVLLTPNHQSLGHRYFRESWRGLEIPRHLHIFSERALRACIARAGFGVTVVRTSANSAPFILESSTLIRTNRPADASATSLYRPTARGLLFWGIEHLLTSIRPVGEEIVAVATKEVSDGSPA